MNFEDNEEQAAYRARVRAWIAAHAPDMRQLTAEERRPWHPAHKEVARRWQATKADAGYASIALDKTWGGGGGSAIEEAIFGQEEARAGLRFTYFMTGLHMVLPALLAHNQDELSRSLIPATLRGDKIWCQLFSEPSSGSDSAGVRTMAVREGDQWVVNGQKVWSSGAQIADWGLMVCRTDPSALKHKGLTVFWVDMRAPGIEVRPIKMMTGEAELNEVFLTDVRISDRQRVGEVNQGWSVVITTLMNERVAVGSGTGLNWPDIVQLAAEVPSFEGSALDDVAFAEWLADLYVDSEAIRLLNFRTLTSLAKGAAPGPEGSVGKLLWANLAHNLSRQAIEILDQFGVLEGAELAAAKGAFQHRYLWAPGLRLGGGSDEILKNILAERVLGLPADIRVDKNVPFRDIPTGR